MRAVERTFLAMGGRAHLVLTGARPGLLEEGCRLVERLEAHWSRFRDDSDISRLNRAAGAPVKVAPETMLVLSLAIDAWRLTGGRFDPTVISALEASGYDRSFAAIGHGRVGSSRPAPAPGPGEVVLDTFGSTVTLPPGVGIDLGGVGKGAAADLVVTELLTAGAAGACLNLGGDLRASGQAPDPNGWVVAIEDPFRPPRELARVALEDGAVVTSSRLVRAWSRGGRPFHHLIDPATGTPTRSGLAAVTVVAGCAWWAEVLATASMVAGADQGARLLETHGVTGLLVDDRGVSRPLPGFQGLRT